MTDDAQKASIAKSSNLLRTLGLTNLPDMTSLAYSGRLQNAIKYCIIVPKMGPAGKELNHSATV